GSTPKALHPIKHNGKVIEPGADLDVADIGKKRLASLISKGRASGPAQPAPLNRSDTRTGRPDLTPPDGD
ncbi:hypothetical protein, partial [Roseobacter litoralis]|uniref:hypothetical protein n=1 Tax=Roseobacter litoralis TaxID=42443 RepID=UPI002494C246